MKRPHTPDQQADGKADELKHVPKKHLTTPRKSQLDLLRKQGKTRDECKEETGISQTAQKDAAHSSTLRREPLERHRRKKIDDDTTQKMIKALHGSYHHKTWPWEELRSKFKLNITERCLKDTMNAHGYHKCRACQKSWINDDQAFKRVCWCRAREHWPDLRWKEVGLLSFALVYCEILTASQVH